ncbi:MAG: hypothetical protein HKM07_04370 [Chlamydiae bacterium]|nr:hypothetical protein [Chlamydiota bacterium]
MKKKQFRKKLALTLLEIMIVIFLIGLISSVIGFNMKGSLDKAKVFKTEKGIAQIKEILLLEIDQNPLILGEITSGDGKVNMDAAKKWLLRSGMIKDDKTFKDGWGGEYEIVPKPEGDDFEVVSEKLKAYEAKNKQAKKDEA